MHGPRGLFSEAPDAPGGATNGKIIAPVPTFVDQHVDLTKPSTSRREFRVTGDDGTAGGEVILEGSIAMHFEW